MDRFTRLKVDGFRRLRNVDLELRPLSVLIGANGSGKTSLLDVLSLLSASAQGKLGDSIRELGGFSSVLTVGAKLDGIALGLTLSRQATQTFQYDMFLASMGTGYSVIHESLVEGRRRYIDSNGKKTSAPAASMGTQYRRRGETNSTETALSHNTLTPRALQFREHLISMVHYHALDVSQRAPVRLPQPVKPAALPGPNGEDLVACLFSMREADRDRYELVEDTLRAAFPSFEHLEFPPVAAGTLGIIWRDKKFPGGFYQHQLSEGILRFLWLIALLESPGLPAVTLIDEPEISLHPQLISLLVELIREASDRSQIIIGTQSDGLVRFLRPEEVVVADLDDDGMTHFTRGDQMGLEHWLDEYGMDELWSMGQLGGRA